MFDVVALGELLIDFTCQNVDKDGYPTMEAHPGGAPANFLAAITKFGGTAAMIGKVGNDAFGRLLIKTLEEAGIDRKGLVVSDDVFTTLAFVTLDETGDRDFSFARKPGADTMLTMEELDYALLKQTKVFHFGTLSLTDEPARSATRRAVTCSKENGVLISYDPNLRRPLWKDIEEARTQMLWGLSQADVVKISDEEVEFLFGLNPEEGAEKILTDYDVQLVYVTCGADGCIFKNRNAFGKVSGLSGLNVRDTTGAGDIFGGSAMFQLLQYDKRPCELKEKEIRDIVSFACTSAGLSTTNPGGISSVPELSLVIERLTALESDKMMI